MPNTGYVDNVYINTSLSYEEILNLIKDLDSIPEFEYAYFVYGNEEGNNILSICSYNNKVLITQNFSELLYNYGVEGEDFTGWNQDFINNGGVLPVNTTVIDNVQGNSVGQQNDLIADLVSIDRFAVPNNKYINKVFLNSTLTKEEVINICDNITEWDTNDMYFVYINQTTNDALCIVKQPNTENPYLIASMNYATQQINGIIFHNGWSEEATTTFDINNTAISEYQGISVGTQNQELVDLVSINSFTVTSQ